MFENLSDKLQRSFKNLRGQGTITDENIAEALREIRLALLESDVSLAVVDTLIEHIRAKALGSQVATALSPAEQIVKIPPGPPGYMEGTRSYFFRIGCTRSKYVSGGTITPPAPITGSQIMAAT